MWPLGHVGHVTYRFINMLFISTGNFDDKLRPQILSVDITTNSPLMINTNGIVFGSNSGEHAYSTDSILWYAQVVVNPTTIR
jgi:hypothetical protein